MIIFLSIVCAILFLIVCTVIYYLYKFSRIIMIFEDDLSEAINSLKEAEEALDAILSMQLFFDSPQVRDVVQNSMNTIRMSQFSINNVVKNFVRRSKQQYIVDVEKEPPGKLEEISVDGKNREQMTTVQALASPPQRGEGTQTSVITNSQQTKKATV